MGKKLSEAWMANYNKLEKFAKQHGHCNVSFQGDSRCFAKWVQRQKVAYQSQKLSVDQCQLLDMISAFNCKTKQEREEEAWNAILKRLKAYKSKAGDCNVPQGYKDDPELGTWATNQRKRYQRNKIEKHRIKKLEELGFRWQLVASRKKKTSQPPAAYEKKWNEMFDKLVAYKKDHGNCDVPYTYPKDPSLAMWVGTQRRVYHKRTYCYGTEKEMCSTRVSRLESIGFHFTTTTTTTTTAGTTTTITTAGTTTSINQKDGEKISSTKASKESAANTDGVQKPTGSHHHRGGDDDDDDNNNIKRDARMPSIENLKGSTKIRDEVLRKRKILLPRDGDSDDDNKGYDANMSTSTNNSKDCVKKRGRVKKRKRFHHGDLNDDGKRDVDTSNSIRTFEDSTKKRGNVKKRKISHSDEEDKRDTSLSIIDPSKKSAKNSDSVKNSTHRQPHRDGNNVDNTGDTSSKMGTDIAKRSAKEDTLNAQKSASRNQSEGDNGYTHDSKPDHTPSNSACTDTIGDAFPQVDPNKVAEV